MSEINTLVKDIQELVKRKDGWFDETISHALSESLAIRLSEHFNAQRYSPGRTSLRLSQMGLRCPCALWYSIHHPELAEPLQAWAEIKFSFGHIMEALAICLAKAAGHEVTGEQDEVRLDGIVGHRDCVIDGCTVDVKSASSRSFKKFKDGSLRQNDSFGYLDQLDGYVVGSADDPLVRVKDKGYILAIDKQLGHVCIYEHITREESIRERIASYKRIVAYDVPPPCECGTQSDGASGNIRLDTNASYSAYKHCCFPGKVRTFIYSDGPKFFVRVNKRPQRADGSYLTEVNKHGQVVYH